MCSAFIILWNSFRRARRSPVGPKYVVRGKKETGGHIWDSTISSRERLGPAGL